MVRGSRTAESFFPISFRMPLLEVWHDRERIDRVYVSVTEKKKKNSILLERREPTQAAFRLNGNDSCRWPVLFALAISSGSQRVTKVYKNYVGDNDGDKWQSQQRPHGGGWRRPNLCGELQLMIGSRAAYLHAPSLSRDHAHRGNEITRGRRLCSYARSFVRMEHQPMDNDGWGKWLIWGPSSATPAAGAKSAIAKHFTSSERPVSAWLMFRNGSYLAMQQHQMLLVSLQLTQGCWHGSCCPGEGLAGGWEQCDIAMFSLLLKIPEWIGWW